MTQKRGEKPARRKGLVPFDKSKGHPVKVEARELVEAISYINQRVAKEIEKALQANLEIGQYVLTRFFDDKVENVEFRGRQKKSSFRELADHPQLQLSKSALHNAVKLAMQERRLLLAGPIPASIRLTHRVALIPIRDEGSVANPLKLRLLREAAEKKLSARALQDRVRQVAGRLIGPRTADDGSKKPEFTIQLPRAIQTFLTLDIGKVLARPRYKKLIPSQTAELRQAVGMAMERLKLVLDGLEAA